MQKATVTSKGQITIPKEIRKFLKIHPGDQIDFLIEEEKGIVEIKPNTKDILELKGIIHRPGQKSVSLIEMKKAIKKRVKRKIA